MRWVGGEKLGGRVKSCVEPVTVAEEVAGELGGGGGDGPEEAVLGCAGPDAKRFERRACPGIDEPTSANRYG